MFVSKLAVALFALGALLSLIAGPTALWIEATLWAKVGRLAWVCAAGAAAYFGALWLLGFRFADFNRREGETVPEPPLLPPENGV